MIRLSKAMARKGGDNRMQYDQYRVCPICRSKLSELMERVEHGVKWKVYECKNCGSEVWINPFKRLIESIKR